MSGDCEGFYFKIKNQKPVVAIMGCSGYLGKFLVHYYLDKNYLVLGFDVVKAENFEWAKELILKYKNKGNILFYEGAINSINSEQLKDCDVIINCSVLMHHRWVSAFYRVNGHDVGLLYEEAKKAKVAEFIQISSCSVYGHCDEESEKNGGVREEKGDYALTHYARSKLLGEKILFEKSKLQLKSNEQSEGPHVIALRLGILYGDELTPNVQTFLKLHSKGIMPLFGNAQLSRHWVSLDSVGLAIDLCLQKKTQDSIFYIVDDHHLEQEKIRASLFPGHRAQRRIFYVPLILSRLCEKLALWVGFFGLHLKHFNILGEMGRHQRYCNGRAKKQLGYQPKKNALEEFVKYIKKLK